MITPTVVEDGSHKTVFTISGENVEVTQSIRIVKDKYEIKYSIKNNAEDPKDIGFMFHIDTKLGSDDMAPFIVGGNIITHETSYTTDMPDTFTIFNQQTGSGINAEFQAQGIIKGDGIIEVPSRFGIGNYRQLYNYDWSPAGDVGDSGYSLWWDSRSIGSGNDFEVNTFYGQGIPPTIEDPTQEELPEGSSSIIIQCGPNTPNQYKIELVDVRAKTLGLEILDIEDYNQIMESLNKVDLAIEKIISAQISFGIDTNVLEHISLNVRCYEENLTAAESRIRDLDFPKMLTELSTNKIILQSAQAMLSQANMRAQGVLNLLQ